MQQQQGPGANPPRLTTEQMAELREQLTAYLEHWKTDLDPLYEDKRASLRGSVDVAQSVLRALFLLNGGALVTLPVFSRFVGVHGHESAGLMLWPAFFFIVGLVFCTAAGLVAHFALRKDADYSFHLIERNKIGVNLSHGRETDPTDANRRRDGEQRRADADIKQARWLAGIGAALAALSLLSFIVGALIGGVNLLQAPP